MASSRKPGPAVQTYHGYAPAKTPGPLGVNDQADPNIPSCVGDTPGSLGINDGYDPNPAGGSTKTASTISVLLLDRLRLAGFLNSVAYVQVTAEISHLEKEAVGGGFSTTRVSTGNEKDKEKLVAARKDLLMRQFAEASSQGSVAAVRFLHAQEQVANSARATIQTLFSAAGTSNEVTTKTLKRVITGLKVTEELAGATISVVGIFVSSGVALAAGIIDFSYDITTNVIDDLHKAKTVNADVLALVSADVAKKSIKSAATEKAKDVAAGKELKDIELLENRVAHLRDKIAIKQEMIQKTSSAHNVGRLTRSISKNRSNINTNLKSIIRFKGVSVLFLSWNLLERAKKISEALNEE